MFLLNSLVTLYLGKVNKLIKLFDEYTYFKYSFLNKIFTYFKKTTIIKD